MEIQKSVVIETVSRIELNQSQLLQLLREAGLELPESAEAIFICPTGHDCSGETFDLDEVHLVVRWTETTRSGP